MITAVDRKHLRRCIELAEQALASGNSPFGSILVAEGGVVLFEDHSRDAEGDLTRHPELEIARWAVQNLSPEDRMMSTVYTSGEHCPMCAAAHAWAGLGRIVYASSSAQLGSWLNDFGAPLAPVEGLPIRQVAPSLLVEGPVEELAAEVKELQRFYHRQADS
ncbi:Guanine deaminase [Corynebacterium occultum]|uniref:Guanine deaminase n=1 Tax=Corynebacterium occultum TaxID=2675219 RepID=A0A6B8VKY6_9CORY|nr:Guanine deaminase [Corynebacterium occultum]